MPEQPLADGLTAAVPRQLPGPEPNPAAARAAMVARLEEEGALHAGPQAPVQALRGVPSLNPHSADGNGARTGPCREAPLPPTASRKAAT